MAVGSSKIAVLLNGPPRAGKDTAIEALREAFGQISEVIKFTRPVKDLTHERFGLNCDHDAYEELKDTPLPEFLGMTPRQAYIDTSAKLKAKHGEDVVRRLFVEAVLASNAEIVLNPDAGDDDEAEIVAQRLGFDRVLVIRIHRKDHDFSQDCRTWVTSPKLRIIDIHNNDGERRIFESQVVATAKAFLDEVRAFGPKAYAA